MEDVKMTSNERLNLHKKDTNEIYYTLEACIYKFNRLGIKELEINNIVKVYRNKIFEIYNDFEKENIDFWDEKFALRDPIMLELESYMTIGTILTGRIIEEAVNSPVLALNRKRINKIKIKQLEHEIDGLNEIIDFIYDYDIKSNINETLIRYYLSLPTGLMQPEEIKEKSENINECVDRLGLEDYVNKEELGKIIETKTNKSKIKQRKK